MKRALIIGGGIAGLVTARVLADHFDEVCLLEQDRYPEKPEVRKYIPQGAQLHVMLAQGCILLNDLLPGFGDRLDDMGVSEKDFGRDVIQHLGDLQMPREHFGLPMRCANRPMLEWVVQREVAGWPGVTIREQHRVKRLLLDHASNVIGACVIAPDDTESEMHADLVVDASGRSSKMSAWLDELGFGRPEERVVDAGFRYYAALCHLDDIASMQGASLIVNVARPPDLKLSGGLMALPEGVAQIFVVTLRDYPKIRDHKSLLAALGELGTPLPRDIVAKAEILSPILNYNNTANRRLFYDAMPSWPGRLLIMGDSLCRLNPRFGQGMTLATVCAKLLGKYIHDHGLDELDGQPRQWVQDAMKTFKTTLDAAWNLATADDNNWIPEFQPSLGERVVGWYFKHLLHYAFHEPSAYLKFLRVTQMVAEPTTLFNPTLAARVLRHGLRQRIRNR